MGWLPRRVLLLALVACGGDAGEAAAGVPCTRTSDCAEGLECCAGTCTPEGACEDAGLDGGPDGGT